MTRFFGWVAHLGDLFEEELVSHGPQPFSAFGQSFGQNFGVAFGDPPL